LGTLLGLEAGGLMMQNSVRGDALFARAEAAHDERTVRIKVLGNYLNPIAAMAPDRHTVNKKHMAL
jgi:hypothetical protein